MAYETCSMFGLDYTFFYLNWVLMILILLFIIFGIFKIIVSNENRTVNHLKKKNKK